MSRLDPAGGVPGGGKRRPHGHVCDESCEPGHYTGDERTPCPRATEYEYGIALRGDHDDPHRSGMTEEEAQTWMTEWVQMSGRRAPFEIVRRPVGEWEPVDA